MWSSPVTACTSSASTQCAEVGWYSNWEPTSQLSRQSAKASRRPSWVDHRGGAERRAREAGGVLQHVVEGDGVLAVGAELGDARRATGCSGRSVPSPRSCHTSEATNGFVAEKIVNRVSTSASPKASCTSTSPSRAERDLAGREEAVVDVATGASEQGVDSASVQGRHGARR